MAEWSYSQAAHRYRDTSSGRFLSASGDVQLRDDYLDRQRTAMVDLAKRVVSGDLSIPEWERQMRLASRETFTVQYAYGRGGRNAMTPADRAALGELIGKQWEFLNGFAKDLETSKLSAPQVEARAQLYANAAIQAHEQGKAAAYMGLRLPAYPADGSAECRSNDRCSWRIVEDESQWQCTWQIDGGEHCATCVSRASRWAPLVVPRVA